MRPSFRPSSIHIMLIVLPQIASKRGLKIGIILFVYIHIKLRAPLSSLCHARIIKMREQCQLICSNRSLKIRICIVVIIWIKPGVSLLAFEVYAFYIKSVARSFYSQLLLLWIPMRTKFPLCFLSAFFLMLFLIPFI